MNQLTETVAGALRPGMVITFVIRVNGGVVAAGGVVRKAQKTGTRVTVKLWNPDTRKVRRYALDARTAVLLDLGAMAG